MYNVTINQIAKEMGCSYEGPEGIVVRRVVFDSREVGPGDLFVAIRGQRVDGHRYIDKAIEAGAVEYRLRATSRWTSLYSRFG